MLDGFGFPELLVLLAVAVCCLVAEINLVPQFGSYFGVGPGHLLIR